MKKIYSIGVVLFLFQIGLAQNPTSACGFYGKKTVVERNKMAPFDKAKKVVLVAFPSPERSAEIVDTGEEAVNDSLSLTRFKFNIIRSFDLPIRYNKERTYFATEIIELEQAQIDHLSNILVNFRYKKIPKIIAETPVGCYEPRNAVLFLDEKDKVIAYLEICFECHGQILFPDTLKYNEVKGTVDCKENLLFLIKEIFRNAGIQYGINYR